MRDTARFVSQHDATASPCNAPGSPPRAASIARKSAHIALAQNEFPRATFLSKMSVASRITSPNVSLRTPPPPICSMRLASAPRLRESFRRRRATSPYRCRGAMQRHRLSSRRIAAAHRVNSTQISAPRKFIFRPSAFHRERSIHTGPLVYALRRA